MNTIIEIVNSVLLPVITVALGYFGWRANADKNRFKAEIKILRLLIFPKKLITRIVGLTYIKSFPTTKLVELPRRCGKFSNSKK